MRGSILINFDEYINDRGVDYFQVEVNNVVKSKQWMDLSNYYAISIEEGDVVKITLVNDDTVFWVTDFYRNDYTNNANGDRGIKETPITPELISSGSTSVVYQFTGSTIDAAYNYQYVCSFNSFSLTPTPTPTPTLTPTASVTPTNTITPTPTITPSVTPCNEERPVGEINVLLNKLGVSDYLYYSYDGGETINALCDAGVNTWRFSNLSSNGSILVAHNLSEVYVSNDSGYTWSNTYTATGVTNLVYITDISDNGQYIVGRYGLNISNRYGFLHSIDSGSTWTETEFTNDLVSEVFQSRNGQHIVVIDNQDINVSHDYGSSWTGTTYPTTLSGANGDITNDGQNIYIYKNTQKIYSNDGGSTFTTSSFSDLDGEIKNVSINYNGQYQFITANISLDFIQYPKVWLSNDYGSSWTALHTTLSLPNNANTYVYGELDDTGQYIKFYLGGEGLYYSSDYGSTWNTYSNSNVFFNMNFNVYPALTPTPTPSITPSGSQTPTPTSTNTPTPSITPSTTPTLTPTASVTPTLTSTPTNTPTPSITPSITVSPVQTVELITTIGFSYWQAPIGTTEVYVECWGSGGKGGNASTAVYSLLGHPVVGGGGGGGAYAASMIPVTGGTTYTLYIDSQSNENYTYFNSLGTVSAQSGFRGEDSTLGNGGVGAAGLSGTASNSIGTTKYNGGNGANGNLTGTDYGGGGGGGAGSTGIGNNASTYVGGTAKSEYGGKGGNGKNGSDGNGTAGLAYASGGGGAVCASAGSTVGGNGSQGLIRLTYW